MTAHLVHQKGLAILDNNIRNGYFSKAIKTSLGDQRIEIHRDRNSTFGPSWKIGDHNKK